MYTCMLVTCVTSLLRAYKRGTSREFRKKGSSFGAEMSGILKLLVALQRLASGGVFFHAPSIPDFMSVGLRLLRMIRAQLLYSRNEKYWNMTFFRP